MLARDRSSPDMRVRPEPSAATISTWVLPRMVQTRILSARAGAADASPDERARADRANGRTRPQASFLVHRWSGIRVDLISAHLHLATCGSRGERRSGG